MSIKNMIVLVLSLLSTTAYTQTNKKYQYNVALNYIGVSKYRGIELPIGCKIGNKGYGVQLNTALVYKKPTDLPSNYNSFINGIIIDRIIMVDVLLDKKIDRFSSSNVTTQFGLGLSYMNFNSKKNLEPVFGFIFDGFSYETEIKNVIGLKMQPQVNFSMGKVVDLNINGIANINPYKSLVGASAGLKFHLVKR